MNHSIQKAVIPVAGLGTRFLPVTKSVPKELLPIIKKPTIQYVLQEAVDSGITEAILIIGPGKEQVRNYLELHTDYTHIIHQKGKSHLLLELNTLLEKIKITYVWQEEQLGLGHAIWCAAEATKEEAFIVLLPDMIFDAPTPCTKQLIEAWGTVHQSIITTHAVSPDHIDQYGVLSIESGSKPPFKINDLVEKPKREAAPSSFVVSGRYLLTPSIFSYIDTTRRGTIGEVQITDALRIQAKKEGLYALPFEGVIFDTGSPDGLIAANSHYNNKLKT